MKALEWNPAFGPIVMALIILGVVLEQIDLARVFRVPENF